VAAAATVAARVRVLGIALHEDEVARRIHARHEEAARLALEGLLHRVAVLLHLPLHVTARRVGLLEQREVGCVVHHLHAEAGKDGHIRRALIRVDERARAVLLVVQEAAAVIALLLTHAVELALSQPIRRGVKLLAQAHRVVDDALLALNLLSRLLLLQRSLLSRAHHLERIHLGVVEDVAPALPTKHGLVELPHDARHQRVVAAADAGRREVASVADSHFVRVWLSAAPNAGPQDG